jgi:SAM-dependent methyltransferase
MAIPEMIARAILVEHKYKPITGNGLLIGRQTMPYSVQQAVQMLNEEGVPLRKGIDIASPSLIDTTTRYGANKNQINDVGFFSLFCDAKFSALDVTDYEGAEIVHDMQNPIPDSLANTVDFMWNGSCLDNIFDSAAAMRNTARMLRPGGRVILMESGTPHHNAYTMYSPAYFFDFFAINNFADCKIYTCLFEPPSIHEGPFDMFAWKNHFDVALWQYPLHLFPSRMAVVNFVIAEKGANSTWDRMPVQGQYRPNHDPYQEIFARFQKSPRPVMRRHRRLGALIKYYRATYKNRADIEYIGSI